jgi:hypothetical protein
MTVFSKASKYLFHISKYLGFAPYRLSGDGTLKLSKRALVWSVILSIFWACLLTIGVTRNIQHEVLGNKTSFFLVVTEIEKTSAVIAFTVSAFGTLCSCKKIIKVTNKLISLSQHILLDLSAFHFFLTRIIPSTLGLLLLGLMCNCLDITNYIILIALTLITCIVYAGTYIPVLQFSDSVTVIGKCVAYVNKRLTDTENELIATEPLCQNNKFMIRSGLYFKKERGTNYTQFNELETLPHLDSLDDFFINASCFNIKLRDQISFASRFHGNLCDVIQFLNSAFSLQALIILADVFVKISVCVFFSVCVVIEGGGQLQEIILFFIVCSSAFVKLAAFVYPCITSTEEVSPYHLYRKVNGNIKQQSPS